MQTYDLLMLAVLVVLTLYGYFKGMAWQVAYIASFVLSYFVAVRFADRVAPSITFVQPPTNKFAAMLIIYAISSLVVWMVFRIVRKMIDSVKMEGFDHQMGAIIGFVRGSLWCIGITFFAMTLLPSDAMKQHIVNSKSGGYIAVLLDRADQVFPPEIHQKLEPYLNRLGDELRHPTSTPLPNDFQQGLNYLQQNLPQNAPQQQQNWGRGGNSNWNQNSNWGQQPSSWPTRGNNSQPAATAPRNQSRSFGNSASVPAQPTGWPAPSQTSPPPTTAADPNNWPSWP